VIIVRTFPNDHFPRAESPIQAQGSSLTHWSQPLVPSATIAGRSLVIVITILTFLAALTASGVFLIAQSSADWRASIAREMTIQVRPQPQLSIDQAVQKAADVARAHPQINHVQVYSREESERLLEPWIGKTNSAGFDGFDLPIPRLIVLRLKTGNTGGQRLQDLKDTLQQQVPGALLDDHRIWIERLSNMANTVIFVGLGIVALVLTAAALAVAFATRGALAGAKHIIEVLHFVGAADSFIAREFQTRFFILGLKGGLVGAGLAAFAVLGSNILTQYFQSTATRIQLEALFGQFVIGWQGFGAIFGIAILSAFVTVIVSRLTVRAHLRTMG
jgi:cell division transport system permease protein